MLPKIAFFLFPVFLSAPLPPVLQPENQPPRLKVRLEVSKKIISLFTLKDGKVFLKNGVEVTLLRDCDVELIAAERFLAFGVKPDPKASADLHRLHIQVSSETPGLLANVPAFPGLDGKKMGIHMPHASFSFMGLGASGNYESHLNCVDPPTAADWERVRLAGLLQLETRMRQSLADSLYQPARQMYHDKGGWFLENPHDFVVSGIAVVPGLNKESQMIPFRLPARGPRQWIAATKGPLRDLVVSAPERKISKK